MSANSGSPSEPESSGTSRTQTPASPLPGIPIDRAEMELNSLLKEAVKFAEEWMRSRQGSAQDFVRAMEQQFGSMIRMQVMDVVRELRARPALQDLLGKYLQTTVGDTLLAEALGTRSDHRKEISSLDELFLRSTEYRSGAKFAEAVTFVSKIRRYSPFNNMLVYLQNPAATVWTTSTRWRREFGRRVKEEARPMVILAPMTPVILVYDVTDTEGEALPEEFQDPFAAQGQFDDHVLSQTIENCSRDNVLVVLRKLGILHAGSAIAANSPSRVTIKIELNQDLDGKAQYATLCHELGHVHLGHLGGNKDGWWPSRPKLTRNQREVEAEAVAYIVCRRALLTTKSAEYLAGYITSPRDLAGISIDLTLKVAGLIEQMGKETLPPRKEKG